MNLKYNKTLINNGFPNYTVDTEIKQFINKPEKHSINNNLIGGACGVMVIVVGNGHGDTSSNPGRD